MQGGDPMRRFTTTEGAREQGTKGAGEQESKGAREQGSRGARERGSAGAERRTSSFLSLTLSLALSLCFGTAARAAVRNLKLFADKSQDKPDLVGRTSWKMAGMNGSV